MKSELWGLFENLWKWAEFFKHWNEIIAKGRNNYVNISWGICGVCYEIAEITEHGLECTIICAKVCY